MIDKPVRLLLDEHIWEGMAEALRERGHDVIHINHTEHRGVDDEPLLSLAASGGRAILTNNHRDFVPLARYWYESEKDHAGIILSVQLPRGELLRQAHKLLTKLPADKLENTVRWLQEFK